jgi:hypothetical protein
MATYKFLAGILVLVLVTLACSGGKGGPNIQETVDAGVEATQAELNSNPTDMPATVTPHSSGPVMLPTVVMDSSENSIPENETSSTAIPTQRIPTEMAITTPGEPVLERGDNDCSGGSWEFKPISIYRYPKGNGTDIVIIDLSIYNGSDQYPATASFRNPVVTTDDGKAYRPFDPFYKPTIPNDPPSPHSGKEYQRFYESKTEQIAPGATSLGSTILMMDAEYIPYTFGYEIPSDRKLYKLRILDIQIECQMVEDPSDTYGYGYSEIYEVNYLLGESPLVPLPTEITEPLATFNANSIDTVCKNPYYPAVTGAKWIYQVMESTQNGTAYKKIEFFVDPVSGDIYTAWDTSLTEAFPPAHFSPSSVMDCTPNGIRISHTNPSDIYIPNEMPVGLIWKNDTGGPGEAGYISLGTETVTVPAGKFDAVKVKEEKTALKPWIVYLWYAKGVGLIKQYVDYGDNTWASEELRYYSFPK